MRLIEIEEQLKKSNRVTVLTLSDLNFLRLYLGLQKKQVVRMQDGCDSNSFFIVDLRDNWAAGNDNYEMNFTLRSFGAHANDDRTVLPDLSKHYPQKLKITADTLACKNFKKSIFFNVEKGQWTKLRVVFFYSQDDISLEEIVLNSLRSSKDILLCYDKIILLDVINIQVC